jgi:NAD(P)-dependent dehydrogenase (short-subunit alcohol dehydrogenase family)
MTDRNAIVTGASGGIGQAVAVRLGHAGMTVAVHYAGYRDSAQTVAYDVTAAGGSAPCASNAKPVLSCEALMSPTSPTYRSRPTPTGVESALVAGRGTTGIYSHGIGPGVDITNRW